MKVKKLVEEGERAEEDYVELHVFDKKFLYAILVFFILSIANLWGEAGHFENIEPSLIRLLFYLELPVLLIALYYVLKRRKKVRLRKLLEWEVDYVDSLRVHLFRSIIYAGVSTAILSSPYTSSPKYLWFLFLGFGILSALILLFLPTKFIVTLLGVSAGSPRGSPAVVKWDNFKSFSVDENKKIIKLHNKTLFIPSTLLVARNNFNEVKSIITKHFKSEG